MPPRLEWGHRKEPVIAAAIRDHYGWESSKVPTHRHREHGFLLASPDRANHLGELIEIKTSDYAEGWGEVDTAEIPEHYWLQVQHQLEVCDSTEVCWVFVLIGHCDFRRYQVIRDREYLPTVIEPLSDFWKCVESRTPPEPDWEHPGTLDSIRRLYTPQTGVSVELDQAAALLVEEYQRVSQEIKALTQFKDEIKGKLIEQMKGAEVGQLPNGAAVQYKAVSRAGYTVEPSTYSDFRIKKAKSAK